MKNLITYLRKRFLAMAAIISKLFKNKRRQPVYVVNEEVLFV